MGVDIAVLRREIEKQAGKTITPKVIPYVKKEFNREKKQLLRDFNRDDVTIELEEAAQNGAENVSSKFVDTERGGNLYSLLGFEAGTDPIEPLREVLEQDIQLDESTIKTKTRGEIVVITAKVEVPTISEIHERVSQETELPWTDRPWTDLLEKGITGFGHYLFDSLKKFKNSFSGPAIEVRTTMREGSLGKIPYISTLLKDFKDRIRDK